MIPTGYLLPLMEPGKSHAYGAWIDGHYSKADFSCAVASEMNRLVSDRDIHVGWYRVLRGIMHFTKVRGRGAKPATWTEW